VGGHALLGKSVPIANETSVLVDCVGPVGRLHASDVESVYSSAIEHSHIAYLLSIGDLLG
jgi:hypothetical protein